MSNPSTHSITSLCSSISIASSNSITWVGKYLADAWEAGAHVVRRNECASAFHTSWSAGGGGPGRGASSECIEPGGRVS